jgi:hypothetical protein
MSNYFTNPNKPNNELEVIIPEDKNEDEIIKEVI